MKARNMKAIQYNNKTYTIPKPFDQCFFGSEPTKEIKLEQLEDMVMVMETFVLLIVRMIGGLNMEQEQLITLVE